MNLLFKFGICHISVSLCNTLLFLSLSQKKAAQFLLFGLRNALLFPSERTLSLSLLVFREWIKVTPLERRDSLGEPGESL